METGLNKVKPTLVETKITPVVTDNCMSYLKNILLSKNRITELVFSEYAWTKINCYINLVGDYEITGFGKVENGIIIDVCIIDQVVESAYVACDLDSMVDFMTSLPKEERGLWSLDWHSHVNMATSPSSTDEGNYDEQLSARLGKAFPFLIINKKEKMTCGFWLGNGKYSDIKVTVEDSGKLDESLLAYIYKICKKEIEEKCTKRTHVYNYNTGFNYQGSNKVLTTFKTYGNINKVNETEHLDGFCVMCGNELLTADEMFTGYCDECE